MHVVFGGHVTPQPPQCALLVCVSAQEPPQSVVPAGHVSVHALAKQTGAPAVHAVAHEPQCCASVVVSTHVEPHAVSPLVPHAQTPAVQA